VKGSPVGDEDKLCETWSKYSIQQLYTGFRELNER